MAYLANTDIEKFLNINLTTNGQSLVTDLIAAVSAYTDRYCNRSWTKQSSDNIVETFDGGVDSFVVKNAPISTVQSITVDGSPVDTDDIYIYDTYVKLSYTPAKIPRSVIITYRTNANAVPADLKHALVRWVSEIFKSQGDAGKTVARVSSGPVSVDFLTQDGIPKFVQMVLDQYKLMAL